MISKEEKEIFEKAKSALVKLGKYSDDKENRDKTKINDILLEHLLTSALLGLHSSFRKIYEEFDKEMYEEFDEEFDKIVYNPFEFRKKLLMGDFEDIDYVRQILSQLLPTLQERGFIIDTNEIALNMMECIYNDKKDEEIRNWEKDYFRGIKRVKPMSSNEWPFLNGVWRQHDSEYVIAKSVLDSYGIDVKEEDIKKIWEERNFELFKRNNPDPISTDER